MMTRALRVYVNWILLGLHLIKSCIFALLWPLFKPIRTHLGSFDRLFDVSPLLFAPPKHVSVFMLSDVRKRAR